MQMALWRTEDGKDDMIHPEGEAARCSWPLLIPLG